MQWQGLDLHSSGYVRSLAGLAVSKAAPAVRSLTLRAKQAAVTGETSVSTARSAICVRGLLHQVMSGVSRSERTEETSFDIPQQLCHVSPFLAFTVDFEKLLSVRGGRDTVGLLQLADY